jgi:hypothetical protein
VTRAAIVLALLALAHRADAFPELTVRGEVPRCTMCHLSPGGGSVLVDYGRNEAGDLLSNGGDGRFLHGVDLPSWLLLGGDFRAAALAYDDTGATDGVQTAIFPMQADLRAAIGGGGFWVVLSGGLRGSTRLYTKSASDYFESTEHYAMYLHDSGVYFRAGKFFPVQGLRLPDHTLYVARYTGLDLFAQPYAVETGYVGDLWELHAAGFVDDPLVDVGPREDGAVVYAELHDPDWAIALQGRYGKSDENARVLVGVVGRMRGPPGMVLLGEIDGIRDGVVGANAVNRVVELVGADQRIARGLSLFGWYQQYQEELGLVRALHHGAGLALKYYPHAHWELIAQGSGEHVGPGGTVGLAMFQVHYYL